MKSLFTAGTFLWFWSLNRYGDTHEPTATVVFLFLSRCSSVFANLGSSRFPGVIVFHYAWSLDHRSYGLFVLTYFLASGYRNLKNPLYRKRRLTGIKRLTFVPALRYVKVNGKGGPYHDANQVCIRPADDVSDIVRGSRRKR
jgi:hypothetical protein